MSIKKPLALPDHLFVVRDRTGFVTIRHPRLGNCKCSFGISKPSLETLNLRPKAVLYMV
jgi:hypothetical protein